MFLQQELRNFGPHFKTLVSSYRDLSGNITLENKRKIMESYLEIISLLKQWQTSGKIATIDHLIQSNR
jgi:hypothetical protein